MLVDPVTLSDLEVFEDPVGRGGIFALVDETVTEPGRAELRRRFERPLVDAGEIQSVQEAVRFFAKHARAFHLDPGVLPPVQGYLRSNIVPSRGGGSVQRALAGWTYAARYRDLYRELRHGVVAVDALARELRELARGIRALGPPTWVEERLAAIVALLDAWAPRPVGRWPADVLGRDGRLRGEGREAMRALVDLIGELDAVHSMGGAVRRLGWSMPEIVGSTQFLLDARGAYHPFVEDAVSNPVELNGGEPLVFLTGPNMAGKTTYLRTAALLVLLAQMGMGVPADRARVTPVEVLLTSLNPSDNLRAGISFFLSEVRRVRQAAEHLAEGRRCFVLFDEVFKGTNVKDALEASAVVILGFARARGSGFVFSSHLVELVEELRSEPRVRFCSFDGRVVNGRAEYSYTVRPGVSDERLGLQLLDEARIPELLARIAS